MGLPFILRSSVMVFDGFFCSRIQRRAFCFCPKRLGDLQHPQGNPKQHLSCNEELHCNSKRRLPSRNAAKVIPAMQSQSLQNKAKMFRTRKRHWKRNKPHVVRGVLLGSTTDAVVVVRLRVVAISVERQRGGMAVGEKGLQTKHRTLPTYPTDPGSRNSKTETILTVSQQ